LFYEKNTAYLKRWKSPAKVLTFLNRFLTITIGLLYLTGGVLSTFSLFGAPLPTLFAIGLPLACTLVSVTLLRRVIPRKRPYDKEGAAIEPLCQKSKHSNSFPSRHTACAFVIGTVLCELTLWLGIPAFLLGIFLAYVRFVSGFHFPTDLLGGAFLGAGFGVIAFFL
ncbi:MAG: phosphatase PAP2 family protein, partial [Clostridia bacterium]|nr:phosphatase PAP2 family protein [Clostridia bacterium]